MMGFTNVNIDTTLPKFGWRLESTRTQQKRIDYGYGFRADQCSRLGQGINILNKPKCIDLREDNRGQFFAAIINRLLQCNRVDTARIGISRDFTEVDAGAFGKRFKDFEITWIKCLRYDCSIRSPTHADGGTNTFKD